MVISGELIESSNLVLYDHDDIRVEMTVYLTWAAVTHPDGHCNPTLPDMLTKEHLSQFAPTSPVFKFIGVAPKKPEKKWVGSQVIFNSEENKRPVADIDDLEVWRMMGDTSEPNTNPFAFAEDE